MKIQTQKFWTLWSDYEINGWKCWGQLFLSGNFKIFFDHLPKTKFTFIFNFFHPYPEFPYLLLLLTDDSGGYDRRNCNEKIISFIHLLIYTFLKADFESAFWSSHLFCLEATNFVNKHRFQDPGLNFRPSIILVDRHTCAYRYMIKINYLWLNIQYHSRYIRMINILQIASTFS